MIVTLAAAAGATVWGQSGSQEKAAAIAEDGAERVVVAGPDQLAELVAPLEPTVAFDPLGDGFVAPLVEVKIGEQQCRLVARSLDELTAVGVGDERRAVEGEFPFGSDPVGGGDGHVVAHRMALHRPTPHV